jgi:type II secretory pathway pseudopilin PulG
VGTTALIVIIVVVIVVVLLLVLFFASRRRAAQRSEEQRERTREEFGSEYERTAQETGSEEEAERELRERRGRVERRVEPLYEESRGRYEEQWGEVERVFVDNPERSIEMADRTVSDILNERNFVSDAGQSDEETERAWPPCTLRSPTTTGRHGASGPTSWPVRRDARRWTRTSSPPKSCARPSASIARSTSGSCENSEAAEGATWERWLRGSGDSSGEQRSLYVNS